MGLPKLKSIYDVSEPSEELGPEALAIIEHIGQILAEEYVQLLRAADEKEEES